MEPFPYFWRGIPSRTRWISVPGCRSSTRACRPYISSLSPHPGQQTAGRNRTISGCNPNRFSSLIWPKHLPQESLHFPLCCQPEKAQKFIIKAMIHSERKYSIARRTRLDIKKGNNLMKSSVDLEIGVWQHNSPSTVKCLMLIGISSDKQAFF